MLSTIHLQSDPFDYIGQGRVYDYTKANALISLANSGTLLNFAITGDEWWYGNFEIPGGLPLHPGTYAGLTRSGFGTPTGGLDWYGDGRGCNIVTGAVTIDSVVYYQDKLYAIALRFTQYCEGSVSALEGTVRWGANDTTTPPGPTTPIPASLWTPPAGLPSTDSYVYLQSDSGDYIGQGVTSTFSALHFLMTVAADSGLLEVRVGGYLGWFQAMSGLPRLQKGYYPDLHRYGFHNPTKGGLDWGGNGRGCNLLTGWFVVDSIAYTQNQPTYLDLRFEQHREAAPPALHVAIHWGP